MGKHTPGPWAIHPVDDTMVARQLPDGTWEEIANTDGDYNQPDTWPTMEANTRLISAAPDLLEALKGIVDDDDAGVSLADQRARWDGRMKAARAALSKAGE